MSNNILEKDQLCYTLNGDGTIEKWYFSGYTDDGEAILRKEKSRKWIQPWIVFNARKVFRSRKDMGTNECRPFE